MDLSIDLMVEHPVYTSDDDAHALSSQPPAYTHIEPKESQEEVLELHESDVSSACCNQDRVSRNRNEHNEIGARTRVVRFFELSKESSESF